MIYKKLVRLLESCKTNLKFLFLVPLLDITVVAETKILTENLHKSSGWLSHLCNQWGEQFSFTHYTPGKLVSTRVVNLRTGIVLGNGGALAKKCLLPFKLGLGGILGMENSGCRGFILMIWLISLLNHYQIKIFMDP